MPYSGTAHYITTHLHQFTERVSLIDSKNGTILFQAKVKNRGDGWPVQIPFYSDAGGIRLVGGGHYAFVQAYSNRSAKPVMVMSIMRLYVHKDGSAD